MLTIDKLSNKVDDLQESIEFTENEFNDKIKNIKNEQNVELNIIKEKLRRNNLRFDGVPESHNESWETSKLKINDIIKNNLEIMEDIHIERAHRCSPTKRQKENGLSRTIIIKLLSYQDKINILKNAKKLKDTGTYINEDFSRETTEKRKKLWDDVVRFRDEGKYAILNYDRIVVRDFKPSA